MKTCAYCGRSNEDHVLHCTECGTNEFKEATAAKPSTPAFALAAPPPLNTASRHPIEIVLPQISLAGWAIWLVVGLLMDLVHRFQSFASMGLVQGMIGIGIKGGAILLSFLLIQRMSRRLALLLAFFSLWAFWRFFLGDIVFRMHPELGGLPFPTSVANWWARSTVDIPTTLSVVPFVVLTIVSAIGWPFYALLCGGPLVNKVPAGTSKQ